jgi:hypothetical protein
MSGYRVRKRVAAGTRQGGPERRRHGHAQRAARRFDLGRHARLGRLRFGQGAPAPLQVELAHLGQALAARRAIEQARAEPLLEARHMFADHLRRQAEHRRGRRGRRGRREGARLHGLHEHLHLGQPVGHSPLLVSENPPFL